MRMPAAVSIVVLALAVTGQDLSVRTADGQIRVSAPKLSFLTGRPLERIRNGSAVAYDMQLSVLDDTKTTVLRRGFERFVISYDLWEERFSVSRMRTRQNGASHLTAAQAEAWCLDNLSLPAAGLPQDRGVILRLEVRAQQPKERDPILDEGGVALTNLIDVFSRVGKERSTEYWKAESGLVRLGALKGGGRGGD